MYLRCGMLQPKVKRPKVDGAAAPKPKRKIQPEAMQPEAKASQPAPGAEPSHAPASQQQPEAQLANSSMSLAALAAAAGMPMLQQLQSSLSRAYRMSLPFHNLIHLIMLRHGSVLCHSTGEDAGQLPSTSRLLGMFLF